MPKMYVKGVGQVEVDQLPKRIPKTTEVLGKRYPVDKEKYRLVWAIEHATPKARKKIKEVV